MQDFEFDQIFCPNFGNYQKYFAKFPKILDQNYFGKFKFYKF